MRFLVSILALFATQALAQETEPFRIVSTPTGCAVVIDDAPEEYRVDALANGGVVLAMVGSTMQAQEKQHTGGCLTRFRTYGTAGGGGTSLEMRPDGVEFVGVIRSRDRLQVVFERLVNISGSLAASDTPSRAYRLGAGDLLKITVYNHDDLTKEVAVGSDGTIGYSLLGDLAVAGKTVSQFQDEITAALAKSYIVNPQVSVEVKSYASQFVYVNGPVKNPGRFPLQGGLTLKDALSLAGGFAPEAGYSLTVARRDQDATGEERQPEKIKFARQDIEFGLANLDLQSGDVVTVSEKDYFYIGNEVREPGKYEIGNGLTLLKAVLVAKGLTDWADRKKVSLIRKVGGQTVTEVINLRDIEKMKIPDVPLVAGDTIIVPRRIL